jgi:methionyl aminopeptidase
LCISINDEIVHGIPSRDRIVQDGDIVSLDLGAEYEGIFTDMAITLIAGKSDVEKDHLIKVTKEALYQGIEEARIGNTIGDIGAAIERYVIKNDLEVIKDYVGHGIGTKPHMWPQIPNFGKPGSGPKVVEGMALAIEPMTTVGNSSTMVQNNRWTVKTKSGSYAAHFEHTVLIENGKPLIVTECE